MLSSLLDLLRVSAGPAKVKSVFASGKEAYDFCRSVYRDTGGVTLSFGVLLRLTSAR